MEVGAIGGAGPQRVDHHERRAVASRLLDERPQVSVGDEGVGAPHHDETGGGEVLGIEPVASSDREVDPLPPRDRADGHLVTRRAHATPDPRRAVQTLDPSQIAGADERPDGRSTRPLDDPGEAVGHLGDGFVPTDRFEASLALVSNPAHGTGEPCRVGGEGQPRVHLGAQPALGERMLRVAADGGRLPLVVEVNVPRAGVGTVKRARAHHDASTAHRVTVSISFPIEWRLSDRWEDRNRLDEHCGSCAVFNAGADRSGGECVGPTRRSSPERWCLRSRCGTAHVAGAREPRGRRPVRSPTGQGPS